MEVLVYKTNVDSTAIQESVDFVLSNVPNVLSWNFDFEDKDNVLRVEMKEEGFGNDIPITLSDYGVLCEELI